MARTKFPADQLRSFLRKEKIATLEQLKRALGTTGTMTVFRKLKDHRLLHGFPDL